MESAHGGFPRNPQEERRNPPMKPRRGPDKDASPRKQGARDGLDRIHAAKGRATGRWQQGDPENDPPTSAGPISMRPDDPPASARLFAVPNIVHAVWDSLRLAPVEGNRRSETARQLRRVPFPCARATHRHRRGTWQPRTSSTPFGMAFGSPPSKETEAPKRPATSCRSHWLGGQALRSLRSLWPTPGRCGDRS